MNVKFWGIMKLHTSNNFGIHSNYISSGDKMPCRFRCLSVFGGLENGTPAVIHTWTLSLQKWPIPIALFVKILYFLNQLIFFLQFCIKRDNIVNISCAASRKHKFHIFQLMLIMDRNGLSFLLLNMFVKYWEKLEIKKL